MTAILGNLRSGAPICSPDTWSGAVDSAASRSPADPHELEHGAVTSVVRAPDAAGTHAVEHDVLVAIDGDVDNLEPRPGESRPAALARHFAAEGPALFERLSGRYALVVADPEAGEVHLVRDRLGSRPLHYARSGDGWAWSSEAAPLYPLLPQLRLDPEGLQEAVHYRWLMGRQTLVAGVSQVMAGTHVTLAGDRSTQRVTRPIRFRENAPSRTAGEWQEVVLDALRRAVRSVPPHRGRLGILLSGGVDSSLIAAVAREQGLDPVAFTPTWPEYDNPELPRAVRFAGHLGIEHRILECDEAWVRDRFPWVIGRMQCLPKHYHTFGLARVFEEVAGDVDLMLYGEGADTMFGGRDRILRVQRKREMIEWIPGRLRALAAVPLPRTRESRWGRLKELLLYDMDQVIRQAGKVDTGPLLRDAFPSLDFEAYPSRELDERYPPGETWGVLRRKGLVFLAYMVAALETVDRMGAPFGVDIYSPFLTDEIVDLGTSFPHALRADERGSKPVIKDIASRYFPEAWIHEKKLGFPTPVSEWLGGPLAPALQRAADGHPALDGLFRPEVVGRLVLPRDHELIWATMCLAEFAHQFLGAGASATPQLA